MIRRSVPVLGAVVLVASGVGVALAGPSGASAQERPRMVKAHVQVVTYNTAAQLSTGRAVQDVVRLAETGADVLALQEMSSPDRRRRVVDRLVRCRDCKFGAYIPQGAVPAGTPVLYRLHRFHFQGAGTEQVTEAMHVGSAGAGPATLRARFVNWVHLRERRTGRSVYVLNNHAVPTVQGDGGGPNKRMRKRLTMYRLHMRGLQDLVTRFKQRGGKVFVTGDLNVNFRTDRRFAARMFPYRRLGDVGLQASFATLGEPRRGTHVLRSGRDTRLIDYVYYLPRPSVRPLDQHVLRGYSSDHRPLLVELRFTRPR